MKTLRIPLALLLLTGMAVRAQVPAGSSPPEEGALEAEAPRTPEELEQLMAPIALYPDALIALILPASTAPADIVLAARHMRDHPNDRSQIEHRAWDESVKSLTHYADVLKWMDENLHWTKQVGDAFLRQPADVMQAIQRLRAQAQAAGTLTDTPQQQVISEPEVIRIVPAQPDVIYVPHYDPEIVFVDRSFYHTPFYYPRPFLTFGVGVPVGSWLAFECDWRRRAIWHGNRHRHWTGHDWRRPLLPIAPGFTHVHTHPPGVRRWAPPAHASRSRITVTQHVHREVARPSPVGVPSTRSYVPRGSAFDSHRTTAGSLPVVNPLPRTFTHDQRRDLPGPRAPSTVVPRANVVSPPTAWSPTPAAPETRTHAAPSHARRTGASDAGELSRHREYRGRTQQPAVVQTSPLPTVPALPRASPSQVAPASGPVVHRSPASGPVVHRSYSRAASPPAAIPALPMTNPSRVQPTTGPVANRSFSRSTPRPAIAAPLPAAQPAPAVSAPAPAAAPQAAPARSRGHGSSRSSGGGRSDQNRHAH